MLTPFLAAGAIDRNLGQILFWSMMGVILVTRAVVRLTRRWNVRSPSFKEMLLQHGVTVSDPIPDLNLRWQTLAVKTDGPWTLEFQELLEEEALLPFLPSYRLTIRPRHSTRLTFSIRCSVLFEGWIRSILGSVKVPTGDKAFDRAWCIDTNQDDFMAAALTPEIRALLDGIKKPRWGNTITLNNRLVAITDRFMFRPPARFARALLLAEALATLAEKSAEQPQPIAS